MLFGAAAAAALVLPALAPQLAMRPTWTKTGQSGYVSLFPETALAVLGSYERREGFGFSVAEGYPAPKLRYRTVPAQFVVEVGGETLHGIPAPGVKGVDRAGFFATPFARYRGRTKQGFGMYVDVGLGLYFTNVSHDVDLEVNTSPVVGFGVATHAGKDEYLLGIRFRHASNGGIHRPNYGQNVIQLVLSARF